VSACRSCNARIRWVKTEGGKQMPVDAELVAGGNIELRNGLAVYVAPVAQVRRYVSHFATCPNAKQHRRPNA
jgi:hypothetical protein